VWYRWYKKKETYGGCGSQRGRKKSNDRDDENFKNEEKPFSVLIELATLENQDLIAPI
jgi:hypothetical protein